VGFPKHPLDEGGLRTEWTLAWVVQPHIHCYFIQHFERSHLGFQGERSEQQVVAHRVDEVWYALSPAISETRSVSARPQDDRETPWNQQDLGPVTACGWLTTGGRQSSVSGSSL
jgi:hypothetical protein